MAELLALLALAAALAAAIVRDHRVPEVAVALGGAAILVAAGVLSWTDARHEAGDLASTLATLAGLLVLGLGCERAGVFAWVAARMAQGARGSAVRLLGLVFAAAAATTAVLGLDATVVLLTPAVFAAAARARVPGRPPVFACTHLANSASLLLPVSNLTNLLAFGAAGISFTRFAGLMALPWAVALGVEWVGHRLAFRSELAAGGTAAAIGDVHAPRAPLVVLGLTLAGFAITGPLGIEAAWPAVAGAAVMVAVERPGLRELVRAIDLPLLGFVLGLGIIVRGVADHGLAGHAPMAAGAARARRAPRPGHVPTPGHRHRPRDPDRRYRRAMAGAAADRMKVLAWVTESGWTACVDTVATLPDAEVTLLHVASEEPVQASAGALAGLLGRHRRGPEVEARLEDLAGEAAEALLRDAAARLGDPAVRQVAARGRPEDVVIEAARDADVLVVVRDTRDLGPRSISHATRFVVDHAPCRLLLAWPEGGPQGGPPPPPPHHPHEAPPPPPPHEAPPPPPQR